MTPSERIDAMGYAIACLERDREAFATVPDHLKQKAVVNQRASFHVIGSELFDLVTQGKTEDLPHLAAAFHKWRRHVRNA